MSEKQKLNLKALGNIAPTQEEIPKLKAIEATDEANSPTMSLGSPKLEKEVKSEVKTEVLEVQPETPETKPAKMSFASIRKDTEKPVPLESSDVIEGEEKPVVSTEKVDEPEKSEESIENPSAIEAQMPEDESIQAKSEEIKETQAVTLDNKDDQDSNSDDTVSLENIGDNEVKIEEQKVNDLPQEIKGNPTDKTVKVEQTETQEEAPEQTPEEIEAILNSAEKAITKKKKKRGWFFKRKKKEKKLNQNGKEVKEEEKEESKEVDFANYESHFTKESSDFLSKFQKFKYTPKTRIGLIFTLICVTSLIIGGLMVFMPNKHSPEIYKASVLQMLGKEEKVIIVIPPKQLPPVNINQEEEVVEVITKKEKSKEKLRQHLLDRYRDK